MENPGLPGRGDRRERLRGPRRSMGRLRHCPHPHRHPQRRLSLPQVGGDDWQQSFNLQSPRYSDEPGPNPHRHLRHRHLYHHAGRGSQRIGDPGRPLQRRLRIERRRRGHRRSALPHRRYPYQRRLRRFLQPGRHRLHPGLQQRHRPPDPHRHLRHRPARARGDIALRRGRSRGHQLL